MTTQHPLTQQEIWDKIDERNALDKRAREECVTRTVHGLRVGHGTGRCGGCGSDDLWDDQSAYGCNACGKFWCFGS